MLQVEAVKKVTLTEQIMEQIAAKIMSGELKAGEKLPNERGLAEMFHVTRSRIREALRALSLIGMITIKPSGGSFVADMDCTIPEETVIWMYHRELDNVDDIYAARQLIETAAYVECYKHRTPEIVEKIKEYREKMKNLYKDKASAEAFLECLDELELYVGKMSGNSIYFKLIQTMNLLRRDYALKILEISEYKKSAMELRSKVLDAFEQDDIKELEYNIDRFYRKSVRELHKGE